VKQKPRLYLDMDNMLVDFHSNPHWHIPQDYWNHPYMYQKDYFYDLKPMPGAEKFVGKLEYYNYYDLWILTQPLKDWPPCFGDKAAWVNKYFPNLQDKLIMTQDKHVVRPGILIDDNPKWSKFDAFFIQFYPYRQKEEQFKDILDYLIANKGNFYDYFEGN
jgi:5'(3')-deoxyribonucleotidase